VIIFTQVISSVKEKAGKVKKLQNPTDNTGYMPLKRHIAKPLGTSRRNETE